MLRKRLIASLLMIVPMLAVFWLDTNWNFGLAGIWVVAVCLVASLVIASELLAMIRDRTPGATAWVVYSGTALCQLAIIVPELFGLPADCPVNRWGWSAMALVFTLLAAFAYELLTFNENRQPTMHIALTMFVVLYAGWMLSFVSATRIFLGNYRGALAVFSILFIIKMSDAGAYFVGKRFGKHKLAPLLSPGKTIEGLVGGLAAAVAAAFFVFWVVPPRVVGGPTTVWWAVLGYALSIAIVGAIGDLCESLIKRDMRCKDSSDWLPGLGGIMDTTDSVLIAAPVAFLWWTTGLL